MDKIERQGRSNRKIIMMSFRWWFCYTFFIFSVCLAQANKILVEGNHPWISGSFMQRGEASRGPSSDIFYRKAWRCGTRLQSHLARKFFHRLFMCHFWSFSIFYFLFSYFFSGSCFFLFLFLIFSYLLFYYIFFLFSFFFLLYFFFNFSSRL